MLEMYDFQNVCRKWKRKLFTFEKLEMNLFVVNLWMSFIERKDTLVGRI